MNRMKLFSPQARAGLVSALTFFFACTACALLAWLVYDLFAPRVKHFPESRGIVGRFERKPFAIADADNRDRFDDGIFSQKRLFDCADAGRPEAPGPASREAAPLVLRGVSLGKRKLALIGNEAERKEYYVAEGENVAGFTVASIEKERVVLRAGEKTMELIK